MFAAQAHSFTQQARLAITLAWVAGYTNIITFITCATATSHMSGTVANLGRHVSQGEWTLAMFSLFLLVSFLIGALASGVCTETGRRRGWGSIYVLPILIEMVLLALFAFGLEVYDHGARQSGPPLFALTGVAAAAMGLQNATITRISSGVVRTTHLTGVLTDLGLESAQFAFWALDQRRNSPPLPPRAMVRSLSTHATPRRLALLASILGSFAIGACLGSAAHATVERWAMFPPVLFLLWLVYRDATTPIAGIEASDLIGGRSGMNLSPALGVFHVRKDADRRAQVHRMPNLLAWADQLPAAVRVVVLDLGEIIAFDANAVLELRAVLDRFEVQGRRLVFSGLGGEQLRDVQRVSAAFLDPTNFCPDLELAIARGLVLAESLHPGGARESAPPKAPE